MIILGFPLGNESGFPMDAPANMNPSRAVTFKTYEDCRAEGVNRMAPQKLPESIPFPSLYPVGFYCSVGYPNIPEPK